MSKIITVYSKHCFKCMHKDAFDQIKSWCGGKGYVLSIKRTAYRPSWHKEATELWGNENYNAFVLNERGKVMDLGTFLDKCKNKAVRTGKKKGAKKNDLQGLPKTKGSSRASSVAGKKTKSKAKNEVKDVE